MKIRDATFSLEFYEDWERVPDDIRARFNSKLYKILDHGELLNSFQQHKANLLDEEEPIWIGYVTAGKRAWRILFNFDVSGKIVFLRILPHDRMDDLFRKS